MPTFLFWNLKRNPLENRVARIVNAHAVDVILLAECHIKTSVLIEAIGNAATFSIKSISPSDSPIRVLSCLEGARWSIKQQGSHSHIFTMNLSAKRSINLVVAHLRSKFKTDEKTQALLTRQLLNDIRQTEMEAKHARTLVAGDLNMNPFEDGVAGADSLHGVMTAKKAGEVFRTIDGTNYDMFYNPMWSLFGDRTAGPPGTYYRSEASAVNYFWNMFDQVLVRPSLIDSLADLRILDSDGVELLLTVNGLPDGNHGSDHLPILFRLNLP